MLGCAGLALPDGRRIARALMVTLLLGFFLVRYVIRQYFRKELAWAYRESTVTYRKARQK